MRIVGGRFGGTRLAGPGSLAIRPTSDRLRETIFNILTHGHGAPTGQTRVLDLFAGSGALGLEALSRGACSVLFVEKDARACDLIRRNVETLAVEDATRIFRRDATRLGNAGRAGRFSLVFIDPPYGRELGEKALAAARRGGWLEEGALIVFEEAAMAAVTLPPGFAVLDARRQGESQIMVLRFGDAGRAPA